MDHESLRAILAKRTPGEIEIVVHPDGGWQIWVDDKWIATFDKEGDAKAFVAAVNACGPLLERVRELEVHQKWAGDQMVNERNNLLSQLAAANERIAELEGLVAAHRRFHSKVGCAGRPECKVCAEEEWLLEQK